MQEASTRWSREEDAALKKAVDELGPRDWKRISDEYLGGKRSEAQCYQRWDRTIRVCNGCVCLTCCGLGGRW